MENAEIAWDPSDRPVSNRKAERSDDDLQKKVAKG
jgi:hypothetical protein